ncbi:MAG: isochorismatase family protein [Thermonemataceae bacterium]
MAVKFKSTSVKLQNIGSNLRLSNANTAIIVIEFQKTWTQKGNFLNRLIRKPLKKRQVISVTKRFLHLARQKDYTIIHTPLILDKSQKEQYKKMPLMPKLMGAFTANTWKAEFEEDIKEDSDLVAVGRTGFDACEGSNLQELVKGYEYLLIAGFLTDQCVEATLQTLQAKGYTCIMISDSTATISNGIQQKIEKRNPSMQTNELLAIMNQSASQ